MDKIRERLDIRHPNFTLITISLQFLGSCAKGIEFMTLHTLIIFVTKAIVSCCALFSRTNFIRTQRIDFPKKYEPC